MQALETRPASIFWPPKGLIHAPPYQHRTCLFILSCSPAHPAAAGPPRCGARRPAAGRGASGPAQWHPADLLRRRPAWCSWGAVLACAVSREPPGGCGQACCLFSVQDGDFLQMRTQDSKTAVVSPARISSAAKRGLFFPAVPSWRLHCSGLQGRTANVSGSVAGEAKGLAGVGRPHSAGAHCSVSQSS